MTILVKICRMIREVREGRTADSGIRDYIERDQRRLVPCSTLCNLPRELTVLGSRELILNFLIRLLSSQTGLQIIELGNGWMTTGRLQKTVKTVTPIKRNTMISFFNIIKDFGDTPLFYIML